jgi:hypothetical protein
MDLPALTLKSSSAGDAELAQTPAKILDALSIGLEALFAKSDFLHTGGFAIH